MPVGIVVADTGPLRYLVLIEQIDLLPQLFDSVAVPVTVASELRHLKAPAAAREAGFRVTGTRGR